MTSYDLLNLIHISHCNGDIQDTIVEVNNLLDDIYNNHKKLGYGLESELETLAISEHKCMSCGAELTVERELQYSEYNGQTVAEEINITCCSECDYVVGS